jgi:excisionase family DNA binding protein
MQTLNAHEAAEFLRIHYNTVVIYAKKGKIPGRLVGGQWRFIKEHLADWISGNYTVQQAPIERTELKIITGGKQCQSTSAANIGGSISRPQVESTYNDLLKLKTNNRRKNSTTD